MGNHRTTEMGRDLSLTTLTALLETSLLAKNLVQLVGLVAIVVEDLHERSLCPSRALGSTKSKCRSNFLNILEIHH
jgi:hypothetical protein